MIKIGCGITFYGSFQVFIPQETMEAKNLKGRQIFRGWNSKFCLCSLCAGSPITCVQNFRPIGWTSCEKNVFFFWGLPIGRNANRKFKWMPNFSGDEIRKSVWMKICILQPSMGVQFRTSHRSVKCVAHRNFFESGHRSARPPGREAIRVEWPKNTRTKSDYINSYTQWKIRQTINRQASPLLSRIFSAILQAVNEGLKHSKHDNLKLQHKQYTVWPAYNN